MLERLFRIFLFLFYQIRRSQGTHELAETDHRFSMGNKIIGITHSIPLNIRTIGAGRIFPPIISLRKKVMFSTR